MKTKVTFHNMDHSTLLEDHALQKLKKIEELLKKEEELLPHYVELWFKAHKVHPHHSVEIHLKTHLFDLHAHDEGTDMYDVLDLTIDKMVRLYKKNKEKAIDKRHKDDKRTIQ